ncbi:2-dehydropantoate 2-reductase [Acuticoccus sp. M5D2P5]|uniref:2-dehydropantoate 2-reductase n=1 Tax=Acuticoccus kalidii TaxID=2910977 RepID=UPI001F48A381|nr:2-dehydropantoate 2-reductase [Acuticoccus kalidii]MCF3934129.1 2-dehydropantoate 2-reductase [Acuticoccus kalidii]
MDKVKTSATVAGEAPRRHGAMELTVAVLGLGGIGAVAAGYLQATGRNRIIACARQPLERIVIEQSHEELAVRIQAITDPKDAGPVDWVLLATKAHQTPSAAPWLAGLCHRSTRVAVLQNGVGQVERTAPWVGEATVVPAVVSYSGERVGADRVVLRQPATFDLAVQADPDGRAFSDLFAGTALRIFISDNLSALAWRKLLINSVANPITALTLQRLGVFRRDDVRALAETMLEEAVAVARADGVRVTEDDISQILGTLRDIPADMTTSMHLDRLAGRALELDALNGAIVAAGERLGIAVPLNRALLTLLRAAQSEEAIVPRPDNTGHPDDGPSPGGAPAAFAPAGPLTERNRQTAPAGTV